MCEFLPKLQSSEIKRPNLLKERITPSDPIYKRKWLLFECLIGERERERERVILIFHISGKSKQVTAPNTPEKVYQVWWKVITGEV